jgi:WD40 repeat protein
MKNHWLSRIGLGVAIFMCGVLHGSPRPNPYELILQAPPATSVSGVAVSPDGSLVATASGEGGIRIHDAKSGVMLRVLCDSGDRCVVFSPDGKAVLAAGFHMDKQIELYDVQTGKVLHQFAGHSQWETCAIAISPDGKLVASACRDHEILVWDIASEALKLQLTDTPAVAIAFSPDSSTLASGGLDQKIHLWDVATGKSRRILTGHNDCVATLAFSPDGKTLASGSCDWANHRGRNTAEFAWRDPGCESQWKLWDVSSGEIKRTVKEPGRLLALAFSPDGRSLACSIAKNVLLYELNSKSAGQVVTTYDFDTTCLAFTPDGKGLVSSGHDQIVRRVNLATHHVEWSAPGSYEQVNSVAVSRDGALLVTGSCDRRFTVRTLKAGHPSLQPGAVRLWDTHTGRLLRRVGDPAEQVMAVAISGDGKQVAIGSGLPNGSGRVSLCDVATGKRIWAVNDHSAEVLAVTFSPDGSSMLSAGADGSVKVRDPASGSVARSMNGHDGGATSLSFSPDGTMLVCGQGRGGARVWDVRTGSQLFLCKALLSKASTVTTDRLLTTVAFTPDGNSFWECIASIGNTYSEPARLWSARTGESLGKSIDGGRPIALSPDGKILAAGGKTIPLKDVETGKPLRELFGYLKKTQAIAFSPDGRLLYSGGSYGTTNVWEVESGKHLLTWFAFPRHDGGTESDDWLAYTPAGFYEGSANVDQYLAWRFGDTLYTPATLAGKFHHAERVVAILNSKKDE